MADSLVFYVAIFSALYLAILLITQLRSISKEDDLTAFFVAGRNIKLPVAIATLGATEIGLITIAYNAQKGFNAGFSAFHIGIAALIGCLFVGLTGFVVRPIRQTGVLTLPEYYERRYGRDVRIAGGMVMALGGVLNMGLFLKVASTFLVAMMPEQLGQLGINSLMVILIAIAVSYTCFGGMKSVISTDVIQFILLVVGLVATALYFADAITLERTFAVISEHKGNGGFDPFISPEFGTDYVLWMILVAGVVSSAIWPTALSRALCIENDHTTKQAYLASSLIFMGRMVLPAFLGVLAFTYFTAPEQSHLLESYGSDADLVAVASLFAHALPDWALGFMVVAMFASFMSTQDGYLFCWASIISRDILGASTNRIDDEAFQKRWTRIFIILIALYELYWGLIYEGGEDVWDYLAITGSIYFCSGLVLLAGGLYWRGGTRLGAWLALILGFSAIASLEPIKLALGLSDWSAARIGFTAIGLSLTGFVLGSLLERRIKPAQK